MSYTKGDILFFEFIQQPTYSIEKTGVIHGSHRCVVLHSRSTPYKTILVAPITSLSSLKKGSRIPNNYVEVLQKHYPIILDYDSYINLDMIMPIDENELKTFEKSGIKVTAQLNDPDLYNLDYKLAITYEMNKFFKNEVDKTIQSEMSNIITFIDKEIREKISSIVSKVDNIEIMNEIISVIDFLVNEMKINYNCNK